MANGREPRREEILRALEQFRSGMLVTMRRDGALHGRPMRVAGHDEDGTVWFVTGAHSGKVDEVEKFEQAAAMFQAPRLYLNLSGEAEVVHDPERLRSLWRESWRIWFPAGPDDPSITLLKLKPQSADLWDTRGLGILRVAIGAVRSFLQGGSSEEHVTLTHQHTTM